MKKLNSKIVHSNFKFDIIETIYEHEGKKYPYYTFNEDNGFIVVLGIDDDKIMMVKQFRIPIDKMSYEFVGGYIEKGEDPEDAARREFLEETGYLCNNLQKIGKIKASVNKSNATGHIFIGSDFVKKEKKLDAFESIVGLESKWVPISDVKKAIEEEFVVDSTTLAAWAIYNNKVMCNK